MLIKKRIKKTHTHTHFCHLCNVDQALTGKNVTVVRDADGMSLGLFGECCHSSVKLALNESIFPFAQKAYLTREKIHENLRTYARSIIERNKLFC